MSLFFYFRTGRLIQQTGAFSVKIIDAVVRSEDLRLRDGISPDWKVDFSASGTHKVHKDTVCKFLC